MPDETLTIDAALFRAAAIAFHHANCHEERGKTYCKPDEQSYNICKFEGESCRAVGNAIERLRMSLLPRPLTPRIEAAVAAE